MAVAAGVTMVALSAVAFRAASVYRSGPKDQAPPTRTAAPEPHLPDPQIPAAQQDERPDEVLPALPSSTERVSKARNTRRAKAVNDSETYAVEFALLQPAYQAVARQNFPSALTAIAEHQHRFPSGQLAEEREALRVKALFGLGRFDDAQRAALAFREHFPRSVLLRRIEGMLGASP